MKAHSLNVGWIFWGRWLVATTMAWVVGLIAAIVLSYLVVNVVYPKETNLVVGLCIGASVGLFQMMAVRRWIALSRRWVWGAMVAMAPPFVAIVLLDELGLSMSDLVEGAIFGFVAVAGGVLGGLLQARVLRTYTVRANWWVLATIVSGGLAWLGMHVAGPLAGGIVLGAAGGGLLLWLLRAQKE